MEHESEKLRVFGVGCLGDDLFSLIHDQKEHTAGGQALLQQRRKAIHPLRRGSVTQSQRAYDTVQQTALPPLPTMTPTPGPVSPATGAVIALRVKPTDVKLWTVVQWQDGNDKWHTVEGWRGELDLVAKSEGWKCRHYLYVDGPLRSGVRQSGTQAADFP